MPICLHATWTARTLIRYVDRFLMFYMRTADRLQRTATWLDNLEGGLDYLRQVVCEDGSGSPMNSKRKWRASSNLRVRVEERRSKIR